MSDSFSHLHVHTEYSMLDGASRLKELVKAAAADGQPALAITDHGNMYGVLDFYKECVAAGINPVIGLEAYMAAESRQERPTRRGKVDDGGGDSGQGEKLYYHLTLMAETTQGYRNLIKLASEAYLSGYYYKARVDWELLEAYRDGIVATTGCLGGLVNQSLAHGDVAGATKIAGRLQDIFGRDGLFVEIQDHGIALQRQTNPALIEIAKHLRAPLLATNDSHYTKREDAAAHDALLCVQTGSTMSDPNRFKFEGEEHYLKSSQEMRSLFSEVPESCDNTLWIAERAKVEIEFGNARLPSFEVPAEFSVADANGFTDYVASSRNYLRHLTYQGANRRYGDHLGDNVSERIEYELSVIADMGFEAYFLVVWDLIRYAKERRIRVGPGRGSAAGCCVAYCLGIVDLDPIRYDLLFERFLNPGRKQMPDIDMDFDERYRGELIRYAAEKYGWDHVAQIITFSTIKARAAVRDAARVLALPYQVGDKIAKAIPPLVMGRDTPLYACLDKTEGFEDGYSAAVELREMFETDAEARRVIDVARGLEGLRRQDSIHAAAVVITDGPLTDYLPIQRKPESGSDPASAPIVTQYEMHGVEELGLLKMDFLGLRNLTVIERALDIIEKSGLERPDIDSIPLDDEGTFQMLRKGASIGVFQLEGNAMRALLRSLAPTSFDDIAALIALYRPGPMAANMHNDYADRKNGRQEISYLHPDLEPILVDTYGLMIYQESVMRVAQRFAGYSLEEADNLRKAAGKKVRKIMAAEREKFTSGCENTGYSRELGTKLFDIIEPFADYGFNKSHSYGYGLVSYQTAWLKANHPVSYMAALLTSVKDDKDKTAVYLAECRALGITVTVPDINLSLSEFTPMLLNTGTATSNGDRSIGSRSKGIPSIVNSPIENTPVENTPIENTPIENTPVESPDKDSRKIGAIGAEDAAVETRPDEWQDTRERVIAFGLSAVRNVGEGLVSLITAEREKNGNFRDFYDFCERVDPAVLSKRTIESLIKAGSFDSVGHPRKGLCMAFEGIIDSAINRRKQKEQGIMSLFDSLEPENAPGSVGNLSGNSDESADMTRGLDELKIPIPELEFEAQSLLACEKEMLGLYVSSHPLRGFESQLTQYSDCSIAEVMESPSSMPMNGFSGGSAAGKDLDIRRLAGVMTGVSKRYTKAGKAMATFTLEDLESAIEVWVFPKTFEQVGEMLADDLVVVIKGRLDNRDDRVKLVCMELRALERSKDERPVEVLVPAGRFDGNAVDKFKELLRRYPGDLPVIVRIGSRRWQLPPDFNVAPGGGLIAELRAMLGRNSVVL